MFILQFLRSSRIILIPLFGHSLGLRADQIGFVLTISFIVDVCFFPLAGIISDKYGRKKCGLPAFVVLTAGMFVLRGSTTFSHLVMSGILAGAGNGFSSGLVMTTGTDLAPPPPAASPFLGLYALFYDSGESLAPVLVGLISNATNLHAAGLAVSVIGLLGAFWYAFLVPETLLAQRPKIKRSRPCGKKTTFDTVPTHLIPIPIAVGSTAESGEGQEGK
jgi:MFS family permease